MHEAGFMLPWFAKPLNISLHRRRDTYDCIQRRHKLTKEELL
jgi:hypothetical protein